MKFQPSGVGEALGALVQIEAAWWREAHKSLARVESVQEGSGGPAAVEVVKVGQEVARFSKNPGGEIFWLAIHFLAASRN